MRICLVFALCMTSLVINAGGFKGGLTEESSKSFYQDKFRGWFWHEAPAVPKRRAHTLTQSKQEPTKTAPSKRIASSPRALSSAWYREHLSSFRDKAIDEPTQANVGLYLYLQRAMMDKAHRFTDVAREVVMKDPMLDENTRRPLSTFAVNEANRRARLEIDEVLKNLATSMGLLFFFRSDCSFCHLETPILKAFQQRYGFKILAVSIDGLAMPGNEFLDFQIDHGQADELGVITTPALFLFQAPSTIMPISQGLLSLDELTQRIMTLSHSQGYIDETTFSRSRGEQPIPMLKQEIRHETLSVSDDPAESIDWIRNSLRGGP